MSPAMSPAMVEPRTPAAPPAAAAPAAASSSQFKPHQSSSQRTPRGQIPNSPFNLNDLPSFGHAAASPGPTYPAIPPQPPIPAPSPAPRLSKPRLAKLRRHVNSPRMSSSHPNSTSYLPPNLGAGPPSNLDTNSTGNVNATSKLKPNGIGSSASFCLPGDIGTFSLGSGSTGGSNSSHGSLGNSIGKSSASFHSARSDSPGFAFSASNSNLANCRTANVAGGISSSLDGSAGNLDKGVFVSGSSTGKGLGSFKPVIPESSAFVFGVGGAPKSNGGISRATNTFHGTPSSFNNLDTGDFIPLNSMGKCSGSFESAGQETAGFAFGAGGVSELNNINGLANAANDSCKSKTMQAEHRTKIDGKETFIYGGSRILPSEGSRKPDAGVCVSGQGAQKCFMKTNQSDHRSTSAKNDAAGVFVFGKNSSNSSQNSKGSYTQPLEEARKPKLQNIKKEDGFDIAKQVNHSGNSTFIFGDDKNIPNLSDGGAFVIGSGSDKGSFPQLHDETKKPDLLKTCNVDGIHKAKQAVCENITSRFKDSAANKLREEMQTIANERERTTYTKTDENDKFAAGVFVFGSNSTGSAVSSRTSATPSSSCSDKNKASKITCDIGNLSFRDSRSGFSSNNIKEFDFGHKIDVGSGFVFGNGSNAFAPHNETTETTLPGKKFDMKIQKENPFGRTYSISQQDGMGAGTDSDDLFKFTFHTGKHDSTSSMDANPRAQKQDRSMPNPVATSSSYPSSTGPYIQPLATYFSSTGPREGLETPQVDSTTQNQATSCCSKDNFFTSPHQNIAFSVGGEVKGRRTRKWRQRSRQAPSVTKQFISTETFAQDSSELDPPCDYSPMDFSPYQETYVSDQYSAEASVPSEDSIHPISRCSSTDSQLPASVDQREEYLVSAAQRLGIDDDDLEHRRVDESCSTICPERNVAAGSSFVDDCNSGLEKGNQTSKSWNNGFDTDSRTVAAEAKLGIFSSNLKTEAREGENIFSFSSTKQYGESNFTFTAPPSAQGPSSVSKRRFRRKSRINSSDSTPNKKVPLLFPFPKLYPVSGSSIPPHTSQGPTDVPSVSQIENSNDTSQNKRDETSQESKVADAASIAAGEACEKWRLRGNQAYVKGRLSKAEDYYTRGLNVVSPSITSRSCLRSVMLCYSNRAATRMSLGRVRDAINDCKMAIAVDPSFLRAKVRVGNCHLALGEIADALSFYEKCLQSENDVNCDQKIIIEASEGLKKAQKVADCVDQSAELLLKRTTTDATKALQLISEALSISPHSEKLMEMKAEALLKLRSYAEVIQLGEQTLDLAEKNSDTTCYAGKLKGADCSGLHSCSPEKLWRCHVISKSYFYLGRLEEALQLLQKHDKLKPTAEKFANRSQESPTSLSVTICELLRLKRAGNEAFQGGRHLEAVEHYTAALACSTESRPFSAICCCNRAAAYQALGQITDAIADCSLAIVLDANYTKALSRRATLNEMIRDYEHATNDLKTLVSILEKQLEDNGNMSEKLIRSSANHIDLKQARTRLFAVEEEAQKGTPLDMYMILGIDFSSSAADVKKAYRKAALRHHPDKAGYFLAKSEHVDDTLWKEVATEVYIDADRLFKMIGEAYATLSDPTKRVQYDAEEELRTLKKSYTGRSTPKTSTDSYGSQYDRKANRRQWRSYGSSNGRCSEPSHFDEQYW